MFPTAVCMAFELCTYGLLAGLLYRKFPRQKLFIYLSLLLAMIGGRLVWGGVMLICTGVKGGFGMTAFLAGALTNAIPGIVLQLILIPILVMLLEKWSLFKEKAL